MPRRPVYCLLDAHRLRRLLYCCRVAYLDVCCVLLTALLAASQLLAHIEKVAQEGSRFKVSEINLHAWVSNEDGIEFYRRHGFQTGDKLVGYYKNISPPDGIVMSKAVVAAPAASTTATAATASAAIKA